MAIGLDSLLARQRETEVAQGQVRCGVRPIFEYRSTVEPFALVSRHAGSQYVVVGTLDNVDGVDLDVSDPLDQFGNRLRSVL